MSKLGKLGKTEKVLLERLNEFPDGSYRAGYDGTRQYKAAMKLQERGLVVVYPSDGRYRYTRRDGSWGWGYHPQGYITKNVK